MRSFQRRRLEKLEHATMPGKRTFCLWDGCDGKIEGDIARLKAEQGVTSSDEIVIVQWKFVDATSRQV